MRTPDPLLYERGLIRGTYARSPLFLQHCLVSGYGLFKRWERRGTAFQHYLAELERTQWLNPSDLRAVQEHRLRILIRHAYEHVPYYRRVFDERHLKPSDIRTGDDLYKLPVLAKQDVRRYRRELQATNMPASQLTTGRTGGSTGIPLEFALDRKRVVFDRVVTYRQWRWAGYVPGDRVVLVRGFTLIPPNVGNGAYWRHDWADNRIYLSGFHLSAATLPVYVRKLQEWRPRFLAGYPSNLFLLARFMERERIHIPVQALFTSSEVVTPTERAVLERQFAPGKVWDRYGTGERLVVGQQCERSAYHQAIEYGLLQVDQPLGQPAPAGAKGELVQTGLTNFSMPLIRYASEDVGSVLAGSCACGRGLALMGDVDGRKDDVLVTSDGRLMPRSGLDQIHEYAHGVLRCQLVQHRLGEVVVRVLPGPHFSQTDVRELVGQLRKRLGDETEVRLEEVDELPLSVTGKERFIISHVDVSQLTGLALGVGVGADEPS